MPKKGKKIITLPQNEISLRELIKILEEEANVKCQIFVCGNSGTSLLYGVDSVMSISFKEMP